MGSTGRTCRVVSCWDVTSQVECRLNQARWLQAYLVLRPCGDRTACRARCIWIVLAPAAARRHRGTFPAADFASRICISLGRTLWCMWFPVCQASRVDTCCRAMSSHMLVSSTSLCSVVASELRWQLQWTYAHIIVTNITVNWSAVFLRNTNVLLPLCFQNAVANAT